MFRDIMRVLRLMVRFIFDVFLEVGYKNAGRHMVAALRWLGFI